MRRVFLGAVCLVFGWTGLSALEGQSYGAVKEPEVPAATTPTPAGPAGSPAIQIEGKNVITQDAFALSAVLAHDPNNLISSLSGYATLSGDDEFVVVTMPFSVEFEGVSYSTISIDTNGWIRFGTATASDWSNGCLPLNTPGGPNTDPLLAAYWDDLKTKGDGVEYGFVGIQPNRTFIVNWTAENCCASLGDTMVFQAQIHETSSLLNVKYFQMTPGSLTTPDVTGGHATIGFQGAGGAAAQAYPLTCDGQILDAFFNHGDGWSIAPVR
jgi:hypothetical protein